MEVLEYIKRDMTYSCYADGVGTCINTNIHKHEDKIKFETPYIEEICSKYPDVHFARLIVYGLDKYRYELESVRKELQKQYYVTPLTLMPDAGNEMYPSYKVAVHIIGFCIASWERIGREPNPDVVDEKLKSAEKESRIYGDYGQLVEMIAVRDALVEAGRPVGNIISDTDIDKSHMYFLDVNTEYDESIRLSDDIGEFASSIAEKFGMIYDIETRTIFHYSKDIRVLDEFNVNIPEDIWKVRDIISRYINVNPVSYLEMEILENDIYDKEDCLQGDVLYISLGTSDADKKYRGIDLFRMDFLCY